MPYAFAPELAAAIPFLPAVDVSDLAAPRSADLPLPPVDTTGVEITEQLIPGPKDAPDVRRRLYRPERVTDPAAAVCNIHGGGFILGTAAADDGNCVALARALGVLVTSVDYRLAPEDPYPAGLEDCYAGLVWLSSRAERIALHGYSAGGGLCAALALLARDRGGPAIAFQYLGVPEVDDRLGTPSMRAFTDTPMWNRPNAMISWEAYLGAGVPGSADVPAYAAPARATDLTGLPPAYVSAMQFDPLRDESIAYALALLAAGVTVELHLFPGTFHGSVLVSHAAVSRREAGEAVAVLRKGLRL